jgi:hypothetical protein
MRKAYDYNCVKNIFSKEGCELLESDYINNRTPMSYICNCGHVSKITLSNFKNGKRCKVCGGNEALDPKEVAEFFKKRGCKLLSYKSGKHKLKYICHCGRENESYFYAFKNSSKCRGCYVETCGKENHSQWVHDREYIKDLAVIRKRCYKSISDILKTFGDSKNFSTQEKLGYSFEALKKHIENYPNWEVVKNTKWHLDHIFPISAFFEFGIKDLKVINSLDNLQPLTEHENISKSDKYDLNEFKVWLANKGIKI